MVFIDTFLFNGDWITQLRLKYLSPFVDFFYIVESRYTFSGARKDLLFKDIHAEWFAPYSDKIRFVVNEVAPINPWHDEGRLRNLVVDYIMKDFEGQEYIVACCDVDELYNIDRIPSKEKFLEIGKHSVIYPEMSLYYYRFTHRIAEYSWVMPFFIHSSYLKSGLNLTDIRVKKTIDDIPVNALVLPETGWHFSYFSGLEEIRRKIQSFPHTDLNTPENTSYENIAKALREGKDLFRRNLKFEVLPMLDPSHNYPLFFDAFQKSLEQIQTA